MPDASSTEPSCPSPPLLPGTKQLRAAWAGPLVLGHDPPVPLPAGDALCPCRTASSPRQDSKRCPPARAAVPNCSTSPGKPTLPHAALPAGNPERFQGVLAFMQPTALQMNCTRRKITLLLEFYNPSWCVASLWPL